MYKSLSELLVEYVDQQIVKAVNEDVDQDVYVQLITKRRELMSRCRRQRDWR